MSRKGVKNKQHDTYYVYKMYEISNEHGFPYIGTTTNVYMRAMLHKSKLKKQGKELSYTPELHIIKYFSTKSEAIAYENKLRLDLGWGLEQNYTGSTKPYLTKLRISESMKRIIRLKKYANR